MTIVLSSRQQLMLFMIYCDPGIRDIRKMIHIYDRADFPAKITENITPLLLNEYIIPSAFFEKGQHLAYTITSKGKVYLKESFVPEDTIAHIKTMWDPELLLKLVHAYIAKPGVLNFE